MARDAYNDETATAELLLEVKSGRGEKVCAGFPNRGRATSLTSLLERSMEVLQSESTEYLWPPCAIQVFGVRLIVVANHNVVSHSCT